MCVTFSHYYLEWTLQPGVRFQTNSAQTDQKINTVRSEQCSRAKTQTDCRNVQVRKVENIRIQLSVFFLSLQQQRPRRSADSQVPLHTLTISAVWAATGEASEPRQTQVRTAAVVGAVVKDWQGREENSVSNWLIPGFISQSAAPTSFCRIRATKATDLCDSTQKFNNCVLVLKPRPSPKPGQKSQGSRGPITLLWPFSRHLSSLPY